jgi:chorismate mutase
MKIDLRRLRKELDKVDERMVSILSKRMLIVHKIACIKAEDGLRIKDKTREKDVLARVEKLAHLNYLSSSYVKKLFSIILLESFQEQKKMVQKKKAGRHASSS